MLELVDAGDVALRTTGVWALDFIASDEDLSRLLTLLNDSYSDVRSAAAAPVGQFAERLPTAMDALAAALNDPDPQVRISVLSALGHTRATAAVPHVTRLIDDPNEEVRRWVTIALDRLGKATPQP